MYKHQNPSSVAKIAVTTELCHVGSGSPIAVYSLNATEIVWCLIFIKVLSDNKIWSEQLFPLGTVGTVFVVIFWTYTTCTLFKMFVFQFFCFSSQIYSPTTFESYSSTMEINKYRIDLTIWDTSGKSHIQNKGVIMSSIPWGIPKLCKLHNK